MLEQMSIKRSIKIVISGDKPNFSNPSVTTRKNTNKNNIGKNRIKRRKIKQPIGKKNIVLSVF